MRKPYTHFEDQLYEPAAGLVDPQKVARAAKLLKLSEAQAQSLHSSLQGIFGWHHGTPSATRSASELKTELHDYATALSAAKMAWAALSIEAKQLLCEVYRHTGGRRRQPSILLKSDAATVSRAANFAHIAVKRLRPAATGPQASKANSLAKEILILIEKLIQRTPTFGSAARQGGERTGDYKACCLAMRAVDASLTNPQCEYPLERALRARRKSAATRVQSNK